jgi:hypothetical protein
LAARRSEREVIVPCRYVKLAGGGHAIICSRGRSAPPCAFCGQPSTLLCDGAVRSGFQTITCDKPICKKCAKRVGKNRDLCPDCVGKNLLRWEDLF